MRTAFTGQNPRMTADDVRRLAERLGIDAVGVTRAEAYGATERHIRERRARGLFADMRFTMARPEELVPSGAAAAERAQRRLGRALLLAPRSSAAPGPRTACALHA